MMTLASDNLADIRSKRLASLQGIDAARLDILPALKVLSEVKEEIGAALAGYKGALAMQEPAEKQLVEVLRQFDQVESDLDHVMGRLNPADQALGLVGIQLREALKSSKSLKRPQATEAMPDKAPAVPLSALEQADNAPTCSSDSAPMDRPIDWAVIYKQELKAIAQTAPGWRLESEGAFRVGKQQRVTISSTDSRLTQRFNRALRSRAFDPVNADSATWFRKLSLSGNDMTLSPVSPAEQPLDADGKAVWLWDVTPLTDGPVTLQIDSELGIRDARGTGVRKSAGWQEMITVAGSSVKPARYGWLVALCILSSLLIWYFLF
jgi:hypothetical protein